MSDYLSQTTFDVIWDQLSSHNVEEVDPEEFMHTYGLETTDFDDDMETIPPSLVEPSFSQGAPLFAEPETANQYASPTSNEQPPENKSEFLSLTTEDVTKFIEEQDNKKTLRKTLTDINKFKRFLETKGEMRELHEIAVEQLDPYLANFILSIK